MVHKIIALPPIPRITGKGIECMTEEFNLSRFGEEEDHKERKLKTLITHLEFGMLFQAIEGDKVC